MKISLIVFAALLFLATVEAFTIHCTFLNAVWPSLGLSYTCRVHRSLRVTSPNQLPTSVRGIHLAGRSNANVRMINFDDIDDLTVIPRGLSQFFPNLQGIRIHDSDVRIINGNELNEYINLRWFSLYDSYASRIPGNLFSSNANMIYVSFDGNYIREVGEDLFNPIRNVRSMDYIGFLFNICINQAATTPDGIDRLLVDLKARCSDTTGSTSPGTTTTSRIWSPSVSRSTSGSSSSPVFTTSRSTSSSDSTSRSFSRSFTIPN